MTVDRNIKEILFCKENRKYYIYFLFATLICFFLSYGSPLYHNTPTFDLSVYINIGRSLNSGKIMYTDIYDTKGPFWYLLCSLMVQLPINPLISWFIFDTITNFFTICLFDKIINIRTKYPLWLAIVVDVFMFSFFIFRMFDKNSEYNVLPIILYIIYKVVYSIENEEPLSNRQLCVVGFLISLLWFIKYTHVVTPGLFILYYVFKNRKDIWYNLLSLLAGFLIICGLLVVYFAINNNFLDYLQVQKSVLVGHTTSVQQASLLEFLSNFAYSYGLVMLASLCFRTKYSILFWINVVVMLCVYRVTYYYIPLYCYVALFICVMGKINMKHIILCTCMFLFLWLGVIFTLMAFFVYDLDNRYDSVYECIKKYDSIYVVNFPQYYYFKNIDMPYYFDYAADSEKVLNDLQEINDNGGYDYIIMPRDFWPGLDNYIQCDEVGNFRVYKRKE